MSERAPELDAEPKTNPDLHTPRHQFPAPWGLLVALALYGLAVLGYVWATYWNSPDYQAAKHYVAAWRILGKDEGRRSTKEELTQAYEHLLESARLKPEVRTFHDDLESLNWRFEEHKWKTPEDLRHNAEAVAMLWQRIQQERKPILVVGLRDKGWAPEQLVQGPRKVLMWSPFPGLLIVAIWAYGRFNAKRVREDEKEADLLRHELEEHDLGKFRERTAPKKPSMPRR